jgi:hypothetical protein
MRNIFPTRAFMATVIFATLIFATLMCVSPMCTATLAQSTTPSPTDQSSTNPAATNPAATNSATDPTTSNSAHAQAPAPAGVVANQASQTLRIAPGSVIPVELTKTVDAKKAKTGDEVVAKVSQDMKATNGEILVPKDTKVVGHVTEAQARSKDQKESQVGIAFDHAVTKSGDMQMPMSIQAIIAPASAQNNSDSAAGNGSPSSGTSPSPTATGGGHSTMSGGTPPPNQPGTVPNATTGQSAGSARPPITASTQGVIGMSNVDLAANEQNGSVVSSEKSNVKLESGTLMLLRVNQQ